MGVYGLTSYLKENHRLLSKDVTLLKNQEHKETFIVDAWSFIYYVAKSAQIPWVFGGEYQEYASTVEQIVDAWLSVGVVPIFVFDGLMPQPKTNTRIKRLQEGVNTAILFYRTSAAGRTSPRFLAESFMLPPLLYQATIEILSSLSHKGVELHFADEEADAFCVELASLRKAYVLALDSDFVILNCEGYKGYVSFDDLAWMMEPEFDGALSPQESVSSVDFDDFGFQVVKKKKKSRKAKGPSVEVVYSIIPPPEVTGLKLTVVHPVTVAAHLGLQPSLLPLLASLLGNDVTINTGPDKYFFERRLPLAQRIPKVAAVLVGLLDPLKKRGSRGTLPSSVMELIGLTIDRLLLRPDLVSLGERDRLVDVVVDSILNYGITPKTEGMPQTKCAVHTDDNCSLVLVRRQRDPEQYEPLTEEQSRVLDLYTEAYRDGHLSHKLLNVIGSAAYWPSLFLEDPDRQSCQVSISRGIRMWIYALLEAGLTIYRPEPEPEFETKTASEDEIIDVMEEDSEEEQQHLEDSDSDASLSNRPAESINGICDAFLEAEIPMSPPSPSVPPAIVVEYVRRGSLLSGVDIDVQTLEELYHDHGSLPSVPQLGSQADRSRLMMIALGEEPAFLDTVPLDRAALVLAIRWVVKTLGARPNPEERWTKREVICLLKSWGKSGPSEGPLPEATPRHIQLTYQFSSAYEAINLLSETLLLAKEISGSILPFSGSRFHEALLSKKAEGITDPLVNICWEAIQPGLNDFWGIERGAHAKKERKRTSKANVETGAKLSNSASKSRGLFAALADE